jgi:hypothetical protein
MQIGNNMRRYYLPSYNGNPLYVMRHSFGNTAISLSKALVVALTPNSSVIISRGTKISITALTAYWSSFQLNNLMHPLVVIHASCCNTAAKTIKTKPTHNTTKQLTKVFYSTVIINEGQAWNVRNSEFTVRHSGIYVFSVDARFEPSSNNNNKLTDELFEPKRTLSKVLSLHISKPNSTMTEKQLSVAQINMLSKSDTPANTVSASCLVNLLESDTVEVWLHGEYDWLPDIMETSVSAFYYSPISNIQVLTLRTIIP